MSLLSRDSTLPTVCLLLVLLAVSGAALGDGIRGIPIVAGDQASSAIAPAGDEDTYVFDAFAGTTLSLSLAPAKKSPLVPTLTLLDPGGAPLDLAGFVKSKKSKVSVKNLPLAVTGRYAVVVGGAGESQGAYVLATKAKPPKKTKLSRVPLPAGGTLDVRIPGRADVFATVTIKDRGGAGVTVLSVLEPDGGEMPGGRDAFATKRSTTKGTLALTGGTGDFVLRLGSAGAAMTIDVTVKTKFPKVKRRKIDVSPLEPVISALDPDHGRPGRTIDVEGENFAGGPGLAVLFGGAPAPYVSFLSESRIRAGVPGGAGEVAITVVNPDGQAGTSSSTFTYIADPPSIATLDPPDGPDAGGVRVDVHGGSFSHVTGAVLGGTPVEDLEVVSDGHLTFTAPAHAPGLATLNLTDEWGQQGDAFNAFTYWAAPSIAAVAPDHGLEIGGTEVTVTGASLHPDGAFTIDGAEPSAIEWVAPEEILFTTPAHARGRVDVRFTDPWGRSALLGDAFEFAPHAFADETDDRMPANGPARVGGRALAIGDLDGDGDEDVVVGRNEGEGCKTVILVNDGDGAFAYRAMPAAIHGMDAWESMDLALGDLDADGDLDLVVTCGEEFCPDRIEQYWNGSIQYQVHDRPLSSTRVLMNDGRGGLGIVGDALPTSGAMGVDLLQGDAMAMGDVDGDSDLDIVLTSSRSISESYYTYTIRAGMIVKYCSEVRRDDRPATRLFLNDGKGRFKDATATAIPGVGDGDMFAGDAVLLGDVDGDADLDIVVTGDGKALRSGAAPEFVSGSKTRVLLNDGNGVFSNATKSFMPETAAHDDWGGVALAIADVDGDGKKDDLLLVLPRGLAKTGDGGAEEPVSSTRILAGSASGFTDVTDTWMPEVRADGAGDRWRAADVVTGDPDGDGALDVFLVLPEKITVPDGAGGERQVPSLRWLRKKADAPFEDLTSLSIPDPADRGDALLGHAIVLGDVDGDDDLDLVLTTELSGYLETGERPTRMLILGD